MTGPRYYVDARRSVPFDTLEEAREYARQNFPAVILERRENELGVLYEEIQRFDWHWDETRGEPVVGFC